jgi:hypothetical protein
LLESIEHHEIVEWNFFVLKIARSKPPVEPGIGLCLYLSSESVVSVSCGDFLWQSSLLRSLPSGRRRFRRKSLSTGARLKFPILEQRSNIQLAFSARLASLKRVWDSGLSGMMDALSCPFILVRMKLARILQLT